jgi:hypothetical protein
MYESHVWMNEWMNECAYKTAELCGQCTTVMNIPSLYHLETDLVTVWKNSSHIGSYFSLSPFSCQSMHYRQKLQVWHTGGIWCNCRDLTIHVYFTTCPLSIHWMEALCGNSHPMVTVVQASGSNMLDVLHEDMTSCHCVVRCAVTSISLQKSAATMLYDIITQKPTIQILFVSSKSFSNTQKGI